MARDMIIRDVFVLSNYRCIGWVNFLNGYAFTLSPALEGFQELFVRELVLVSPFPSDIFQLLKNQSTLPVLRVS